ncbi:MAG: enoyl-CoA hydratase/isomerase family protein [Bernardetiaceae bacterium]|nr:enoyl-CoA hydratase/isomerase family protein [Bernardetiaceae bacterium]
MQQNPIFDYLEYEVKDRIAYITLNRPEKRNAFSYELVTQLKTAFAQADEDTEVKVIVLRANGEVFCAGADLGYLQGLQRNSYEENLADSSYLKDLYAQIYRHRKVVIAQIQGHAIAGGCGLMTVCDYAFAVPEAKFGYTEVAIGFVPAIVMLFALRKLGEARAKEILLSGELIDAKKAYSYGMLTELVDSDALANRVYEFAQRLCRKNSAEAMTMTKQMIAQVQEMSLEDGLKHAAEINAKARATADCKRGIAAFLEKEKIQW